MGTLRKSNPAAFKPGCAPGPGRPLGARSKLSELALKALRDDFELYGPSVIAQVRETKPHHYLSIVASLLPRQLQVERSSPLADLTDEELAMIEETLRAGRARDVSEVNGTAVAVEPVKPEKP